GGDAGGVGELGFPIVLVEVRVLLADVRATDRAPETVLPRRHAPAGRVQDPPAVARGDRDEARDAAEVPLVFRPAELEELRVEPDEDGVVAALDGHELADADADQLTVAREE